MSRISNPAEAHQVSTTPDAHEPERVVTHDAIRKAFAIAVKLGCRPTITGLENTPTVGGFIVASNHLSFLDSVLIQAVFPRPVSFFAKAEYFTQTGIRGRAMKLFFESVGSVPVERQRQSASVEALYSLGSIASAGHGVGIYPEGTRSRDGRLYRGKNGVGWLAVATGLPVVPVGLRGTESLQKPDSHMIRPHTFEMHVGEPLHFPKLGEKHPLPARRQATDQIMDAIAALSGQERVASYNAPPAEADD
ncbi:lysophospholipid acyltransferase family protein [Nesterenkonia lutea]|uniref:1-acyl-sn-glycerol-3-phosphate acyltransferase n=1 Tax=Nesterenkonia lutea TaxID=272919 RepID=A0ABR9JDX4_9MICC|nr:lysophospholipid acyltransferase family protein [Nesterenkonia lutea]MBE1524131.1 1-acyl-sn-glycerol-3-phosphate acyltransferase [Nesterenkonia lutea]